MHKLFRKFADTRLVRHPATRVVLLVAATGLAALVLLALLIAVEVRAKYNDKIFTTDTVAQNVYGVVLGASINPKTLAPSDALRDRLDTAIDLLKKRKIMGVVVTGDDGRWLSDEVTSMVNYLHAAKVPDDIIFVDGGAYRTFSSCEHLKAKGFTRVTLLTQRFHLPRALYLCNELGVEAVGVNADRHWYVKGAWYWLRDWLASPFAYLDVRGMAIIKKGPAL